MVPGAFVRVIRPITKTPILVIDIATMTRDGLLPRSECLFDRDHAGHPDVALAGSGMIDKYHHTNDNIFMRRNYRFIRL